MDTRALIGRDPGDRDVYIATGDSGNGMTHGTIGGMLITDLIAGRNNLWEKLCDPSRKALKSAGEFTKENANVAVQFSGAVLRSGMHKIAVYNS